MIYDIFMRGGPIINKKYQIGFILHFCISVLAAALFSALIFHLYTYRDLGSSHYQAILTLHGLKQNILPAMVLTGGIVIIFTTLAVLLITLFSSHKIAGPIYKLEKSLEAIGNGELNLRIRFRRHDAVERLASDLNEAMENLDIKISDISRNLKEIRKEAEALRSNPEQSPAILMEKIGLVKKLVSDFKTE